MSRKIVEKNSLLAKKTEERIEIDVGDDEILVVYVKPLTFLDLQHLIENVIDVSEDTNQVNLAALFDFLFTRLISRTEPDLTPDALKLLPAEIAQKILMALPSLNDMGDLLTSGFRN